MWSAENIFNKIGLSAILSSVTDILLSNEIVRKFEFGLSVILSSVTHKNFVQKWN